MHKLLGLMALAAPALAQTAPPQHLDLDWKHDTGWVQNNSNKAEVIASFTVDADGHDWIRVYFEDAVLPRGTELWVTSWQDGDVQVLNGQTIQQWQNSTCYLNGDKLQVEIHAQPGSGPARIHVSEIDAGIPAPQDSICGPTDDRVSSNDPRAARLMPVGCTGWLIDDCGGCFLTAGHCTGGSIVAQFNVPASTSGGSTVNPPASDQYPYDPASMQSNGGQGVGNDWAFFGCFPNSSTSQNAIDVQGPGFTLAGSIPSTGGTTIRITGYGVDSGSANQTQQTNTGAFVNNGGSQLGYVVDTTGGNSGSPVINENTGQAIGIHTHGGCSSSGGNNWGTQVTLGALQSAIANPTGVCASNCGGGGGGGGSCQSDQFGTNHSCASASTLSDGSYSAWVCKTEPDFFMFTVASGATFNATVDHVVSNADIDVMLYDTVNCTDDQGSACAGTLDCAYTTGSTETISWTNTSGATMTVTMRVHVWPSSNGDGAAYDMTVSGIGSGGGGGGGACGFVPDMFEPNQDCTTASPLTDGTYSGLNIELADSDYYSLTVDAGATVDLQVLHSVSDADVDAFLYAAASCNATTGDPGCGGSLACGYTGSNDEFLTWTNTTGAAVDCVLRVSVWPSSSTDCAPYTLVASGISTGGGGGGSTSVFCSPGQPNSTGVPSVLSGTFSGGNLHLEAAGGPNNEFAYFIVSATTTAGAPVSQGLLCLGAPIGRYNASAGGARNSLGRFNSSGILINQVGTSSAPGNTGYDVPSQLPSAVGGGMISPGQSWHFQLWYRNGSQSNFTNGLTANF